jgi:hypothetical protein
MELKDPRVLLYDRVRAIPVKPKSFKLTHETLEQKTDLLKHMEQLYQQATTLVPDPEEEWYTLFPKAREYMKHHSEMTEELIDRCLIQHLCEENILEKELDAKLAVIFAVMMRDVMMKDLICMLAVGCWRPYNINHNQFLVAEMRPGWWTLKT